MSEWCPIHDGKYEVSDEGQIRNRATGRMLTARPWNGYLKISLGGHKGRMYYVHRLVAMSFIGQPPTPRHEVNHKNGIRDDCRVANLEWVTRSENNKHSYKYLNRARQQGERCGRAILTDLAVRKIRAFWKLGFMQKDIAAAFGVARPTVWHIIHGKRWAHLG